MAQCWNGSSFPWFGVISLVDSLFRTQTWVPNYQTELNFQSLCLKRISKHIFFIIVFKSNRVEISSKKALRAQGGSLALNSAAKGFIPSIARKTETQGAESFLTFLRAVFDGLLQDLHPLVAVFTRTTHQLVHLRLLAVLTDDVDSVAVPLISLLPHQ